MSGAKTPYRLVNFRLYRAISSLSTQLSDVSQKLSDAQQRIGQLERALEDMKLPSIMFIAIPKSAGTYIYKSLAAGLGLQQIHTSLGYFPHDMFVWEKLNEFRQGNKIDSKHIDASPVNLWFLSFTKTRTIVHVRDPRAAILSWVHNNRPFGPDTPGYHIASPGAAWFKMPFEQQIEWTIQNHLPLFVAWMEKWLDAEEGAQVNVMFTQYEEFIQDRVCFFNRILDFYGIPRTRLIDQHLTPTKEMNFRKGDPNEWRYVMTSEQKHKASELITDRLYKRFGWPRD